MGWLRLENEVCVVTGALGGVGQEICREFARNGARPVLLDLDGEETKTTAAAIGAEHGVETAGFGVDVTDEESVQRAVDATMARFGKIDVLVNTAGILRYAPMEDLPLGEWQRVLDVNLTGYFLAGQRFGREMIKAGGGRLVHVSSVMARFPETYSGAYSPSKAAVNALSRMFAVEWGPYGVRSNCVVPCFVKTPLTEEFYQDPEVEHGRARLTALGRIGKAEDIANVVAFLASPRSDDVTGAEIEVDGGFSDKMGDLVAKKGGRRSSALDWMSDHGIPSWSEEAGVAPGERR